MMDSLDQLMTPRCALQGAGLGPEMADRVTGEAKAEADGMLSGTRTGAA